MTPGFAWRIATWRGIVSAAAAVLLAGCGSGSVAESRMSTEASSGSSSGAVTGNVEDWVDSVCRTGTYTEGTGLGNVDRPAVCSGRNGNNVFMCSFDSKYELRNGLAQNGVAYYVSGLQPDGTRVVFAEYGDGSALKPLTQFGFTINKAPKYGQ